MPKHVEAWTEEEVLAINRVGFHAIGDPPGLCLQVTPTGARTWLLRVSIGGKVRHMGLGSVREVSLEQARTLAHQAKQDIREGRDPIEERRLRNFFPIEHDVRESIPRRIRRCPLVRKAPVRLEGIYFLSLDGRIVYVGESYDIMTRISDHKKGRGSSKVARRDKDFDSVSYIPMGGMPADGIARRDVEEALISLLSPALNNYHQRKRFSRGHRITLEKVGLGCLINEPMRRTKWGTKEVEEDA